jgi:hypothetical protein
MSRPLYHHTHQFALPRILRDGYLRPINLENGYRDYLNSKMPGTGAGNCDDFVHATTDPNGDATSAVRYCLDENPEGIIRVRFTLHGEDFEPWRTVVDADPTWRAEHVAALEKSGRERGSNPSRWFARKVNLPLDRVVAIHYKRDGEEDWTTLETTARGFVMNENADTLGVPIGGEVHWSKHSIINPPGVDGYKFITRTPEVETIAAATKIGSADDGSRVYIIPQSFINGYREKPPAPLAIMNPNARADPLASLAASFKNLPASANAEIVTTPVRYHLDTDLFKAFEYDQAQEYKAQLIAEGRWRLPNDGGRYTIRFNYWDVPEAFGFTAEMRSNWNGPNDGAAAKAGIGEFFVDFDMDGETMTRATDVVRSHLPGLSLEQKKLTIENPARVRDQDVAGYDYSKASAWWEANGWLVHRCDYSAEAAPLHETISRNLLDVLVIALMDRSVVRVVTDRPEPSKKWKASGLAHPEQDVQEITIYCPGRVTGGDGTGTHASPRMHWRRGHNRTLTKGRDMPLVVPIAPMWINADEESEKTIPLRSYKVKASAAEASPAERGRKRA